MLFCVLFNKITFFNSNANATSLNEVVDEYNGTSCSAKEICHLMLYRQYKENSCWKRRMCSMPIVVGPFGLYL